MWKMAKIKISISLLKMHSSCTVRIQRKSICSVQKSLNRSSAGSRHLRMKGSRSSLTKKRVSTARWDVLLVVLPAYVADRTPFKMLPLQY